MKQCPECNEVFDNQKAYCDVDGSMLVKLTDSPRAISQTNTPPSTPVWMTGVIGGLIGIIVCVLLYIAFLAPSRENAQQDRRNQNTETMPPKSNQVAVVPTRQLPPGETATPEESPAEAEASPAASPAAPVANAPTPAALNTGPIATGPKSIPTNQRAIIKMKDGSSLEADAAWEDAQGIWFRRSGVVSFLDKSKVEAITEPPQKRPADVKTP
ncbi:MAG TPA: hypothetical protein VFI24_22165 [Pyrinomonadaceae bacterium]|nr:hypothetical protein [Pyrinomonadaceae bacterium]